MNRELEALMETAGYRNLARGSKIRLQRRGKL